MSLPRFSSPTMRRLDDNTNAGQPLRRSRAKRTTTGTLAPPPKHIQPTHHPRFIRRRPSISDNSIAAEQVLGAPPSHAAVFDLHAAMLPPTPPPYAPPVSGPISRWAPFTTKTPIIILVVSLGMIALYSVGRLMLSGQKQTIVKALRKLRPQKCDIEAGVGWVMIKHGRAQWNGKQDKESLWGAASETKASQSSLEKFLNQKYPQRPCKAVLRCDPLVRRHTLTTLIPPPPKTNPSPDYAPSQDQRTRSLSVPVLPSRRYSGPSPELYTIDEDEEHNNDGNMSDVPLAELYGLGLDTDSESGGFSDSSEINYDSEMASIAHALGAALQYCSSSLDSVSTAGVSPEDTLAAVMALRSGLSSVNVRARTEGRPRKGSEASSTMTMGGEGADRGAGDAFSSDGSTNSSLTSIGSSSLEDEAVFEVRRAETRSMDFKRGMVVSIASLSGVDAEDADGEKGYSRVIVSESTSVGGGVRYSLADDRTDASMDLGDLDDFPRPPVFLGAIKRTSTTLSSDIEKTLNTALADNPFTWKRTASAPALTQSQRTTPPPRETSYVDLVRTGATSMPWLTGRGKSERSGLGIYTYTATTGV
ncbi:hypothetical protein OF83DRAFT_1171250 [Amylostereum chailletii]|nr:hypothetical protein OF83DRAFT_1171250 [Amylostereum chailletii]